MSCSLKHLFIVSNAFGFVFLFLLYLLQPEDIKMNIVPNIATGPFIALDDNKTFITSPYYDLRETNLIRTIVPNVATSPFIALDDNKTFITVPYYDLRETNLIRTIVPNVVTGPFIALDDNKTFIISPYYDLRETNLIRTIAIVHRTVKDISCSFYCKHIGVLHVGAEIDIVKDHFGFPFETANLLCKSPSECDYVYMSVHRNSSKDIEKMPVFKIPKEPLKSFSASFTVCISAFYGRYNNVLQVIQAIEMYKLLGASRVTIYNNSCHENVDKVLRYYIQEGIVDVIPWPVDKFLRTSKKWKYVEGLDSDIGYYGQVASLNDCMYRNMYKSEYVLLNDIDEIILPVKYWNWSSLMRNLQKRYPKTSVFRFENHVFPTMVNASEFKQWNHITGNNILQHPYRELSNEMSIKPRKMIINPRKVIQTSIHSVLKAEGHVTKVSSKDAILFHCKLKINMKDPEKYLIKDNILLRYNVSLIPKVDKVVQKLFPQH